jgi:hypothetical protein
MRGQVRITDATDRIATARATAAAPDAIAADTLERAPATVPPARGALAAVGSSALSDGIPMNEPR